MTPRQSEGIEVSSDSDCCEDVAGYSARRSPTLSAPKVRTSDSLTAAMLDLVAPALWRNLAGGVSPEDDNLRHACKMPVPVINGIDDAVWDSTTAGRLLWNLITAFNVNNDLNEFKFYSAVHV